MGSALSRKKKTPVSVLPSGDTADESTAGSSSGSTGSGSSGTSGNQAIAEAPEVAAMALPPAIPTGKATRDEMAMMAGKKPKKPTDDIITGKIDSGCTTTILSSKTLNKLERLALAACPDVCSVKSTGSTGSTYKFADGEAKTAKDNVRIMTEVNGTKTEVTANVFDGGKTPFLLGLNWLRENKATINFDVGHDRITIPKLGLHGKKLPRERPDGLSVMPFMADYNGVLKLMDERVAQMIREREAEEKED